MGLTISCCPGAASLSFLLFLSLSVADPRAGGMALHLCGSREFPVLSESLESLIFVSRKFLDDHLVQPPAFTPENEGSEIRKGCEQKRLFPVGGAGGRGAGRAGGGGVRVYNLKLIDSIFQSVD